MFVGLSKSAGSCITTVVSFCHIHKFTLCLSQKMSHGRITQLRDLQSIIEEISRAIMWVNEREEEELMFDWGDKNVDKYIPMKQENYSVRLLLVECIFFWFLGVIVFLIFDVFYLFYRYNLSYISTF